MKLTKYAHAHVSLESEGQKLLIDPGVFTTTLEAIDGVVAVVITHNHADHFKPEHLQAIREHNPEVVIFSTAEVAGAIAGVTAVTAGDIQVAGPFKLQFFGDMHAVIHPDYPYPHNIGVLVSDVFYYPGDSFTLPQQPVQVLALPLNAPWAKIQETMDYMTAVKPVICFPTHNALLTTEGAGIYHNWCQQAAGKQGIDFRPLDIGESLDC